MRGGERPALAPLVDEDLVGAGLGEAGAQAGDVAVDGTLVDLLARVT